jgi:hypothetical protein
MGVRIGGYGGGGDYDGGGDDGLGDDDDECVMTGVTTGNTADGAGLALRQVGLALTPGRQIGHIDSYRLSSIAVC